MFWPRKPSGSASEPLLLRLPDAAPPLPVDDFSPLEASAAGADPPQRAALAARAGAFFLELDRWHLLARGDQPGIAGAPPLLVVTTSGQGRGRYACAFGSRERAAAAIRRLGLGEGGRSPLALHLPVDQACNILVGSDAIDGVLLNPDHPERSLALGLADLAAQFEERFDRLTPRMFGRFAEAVNRGGAPLRARLIRRLLEASEWWFVATTARPHAPALIATSAGQLAIPIYTDGERARRGGAVAVEPLGEGHAVPVPGTPRDGVSYLRRLHERMRSEVIAVIVNHVPGEPGEPAPIPIAELLDSAEAIGL